MSSSLTPSAKVTAAALAGALTAVVVWIVTATSGVDVPPEVAAALTTILAVAVAYLVPDRSTS